jgi:hypothetical protein
MCQKTCGLCVCLYQRVLCVFCVVRHSCDSNGCGRAINNAASAVGPSVNFVFLSATGSFHKLCTVYYGYGVLGSVTGVTLSESFKFYALLGVILEQPVCQIWAKQHLCIL